MNDSTHRECGACHRLRRADDLDVVTITNEHGDEQATMFVACRDSKHCATIVRNRMGATDVREK